jgi:hypothetical protein
MRELIDAYNRIRKVHYKIVDIEYSLSNSNRLLDLNGASCTPKHVVLFDTFSKLGFETRFCVHEFHWADFKLDFPQTVSELLKDSSSDIHTNLEIKLGDNWIMVDATWDDKLIDTGFPGTKNWNGTDSTINAVYSNNVYRFNSIQDRDLFLKDRKRNDSKKELLLITALNDYFETIRD